MVWAQPGAHRLAFTHDGHLFQHDGRHRLVLTVAFDAGNGLDHQDAGFVALAEDGVTLIEVLGGHLGDEELAAVGVGA
jgi:hypothetical protein